LRLQAKRTNKLSTPAAEGLKKLESLLGKLEDLAASPDKREIGKLLETTASPWLEQRGGGRVDETSGVSQLRP
jgi:hypothetical protein